MTHTTKHPFATLLLLLAVALAAISCRPSTQTGGPVDRDSDTINSTPPVTLNAGEDKPRILMLHGGGSSAAGFARQRGVRDLAEALPQYTFVFADAPEPGGLWLRDPPSKSQPSTDPGWADRSVEYLDAFVEEHGPFHAVVAYSQGCPMALVYLAHAPADTFQKAALFNGYAPTTHLGLLGTIDDDAPFTTPTLVFSGEHDVFADLAPGLAERFQSPATVHSPTAGHHLPYESDPTFQQVIDFLR
ncbi:hypothetical protein OT109_04050 [Phycisphaeraceae bacterium D3-23]